MTLPVAFKIPHDVANEQAVIVTAIRNPKHRRQLLTRVRSEQFLDPMHAFIWAALRRCDAQGHMPSTLALAKLGAGKVDKVYLDTMLASVSVDKLDLKFCLDALNWDYTRAKAIQGPITELLTALQDPGTPPARVASLAKSVPIALQGAGSRTHLQNRAQLVAGQRIAMERRRAGIGMFPTGIEGLDFYPPNSVDDNGKDISGDPLLVPGLEPGQITTVTAISGGGKSTITCYIVLQQARMCAAKGSGSVLFGSWEMSPGDSLELLACISTGISRTRVKTGQITDGELNLLLNTMEEISKWVKFFDMPFHKERGVRHTHDEVLDVLHGYIADSGAQLAVFDLWRRAFRRMKDESDEHEALIRMQAIAEETGCHCMLVQQQRLKDIEVRQNPVPTREGIKGSSAWVDISDTILAVHLPGLMRRVSRNCLQIHVLKQRFGRWPLIVEYVWDGDLVKLSNPKLVWDMAIGDETRVQSGGPSSTPTNKKDLAKVTEAKKGKSK